LWSLPGYPLIEHHSSWIYTEPMSGVFYIGQFDGDKV